MKTLTCQQNIYFRLFDLIFETSFVTEKVNNCKPFNGDNTKTDKNGYN